MEPTPKLTLRAATMEDAKSLFTWRNDPATRQAALNTEEVAWDSHVVWLQKSLSSRLRTLWVFELDRVPVGTARADQLKEGGTELSWTVAPEARGRGLGKRIVEMATAQITGPIIARIRNDNGRSQAIARACGFTKSAESDGVQTWLR